MSAPISPVRPFSLATLLPLAVLAELFAIAAADVVFSYLSCGLFLGYFVFRFKALETYARVLGLATLGTLLWVTLAGAMSMARLGSAAESAAYYASFLGSLGLMQSLVRRFELLRRVHDVLLGGHPSLIYPKYALTSCGIASVLNFSVMNVLCGSLMQTLDERGITGQERLKWLRSILIVTLRGFALVPLVAPTSVAIAIITREVPALTWGKLVPYTAVAALCFVVIGWWLESRRFREVSQQRVRLEGLPPGTWTLVGCVMTLLLMMTVIVLFTGLSVSQAAMMSIPALTVGYLSLRESQPRALWAELQGNLGGLQNEMFIFACSAVVGGILASLVPAAVIAGLAAGVQWQLAFAVLGMLLIIAGASIGISPLVVLTFLAGILAQLHNTGMPALVTGIALAVGFSMAMLLSPFGPSVMILARIGRLSRFTVAFGWNAVFALLSLPVMIGLLALAVYISAVL